MDVLIYDALVIGAGPAGLMAADTISAQGYSVLLADQKPSFGRKFLMAGKSGLNVTKAEALPAFLRAYDAPWLVPMLREFGPQDVQLWAKDLGQALFVGSTGRVFPDTMKASPLLRAWLLRLQAQQVAERRGWRFVGWEGAQACFETPKGAQRVESTVTILALGGGSWARLGSDGTWAGLPELAAHVRPFLPSNTGLAMSWSHHMTPHFGRPLKAVRWQVVDDAQPPGSNEVAASRGEAILSAKGLEGGGIYPLIPPLRPPKRSLRVDLSPDVSLAVLSQKLKAGSRSLSQVLRNRLKWPAQKVALFHEWKPAGGGTSPAALARQIKALDVPHLGPRPMDEAISTAGGLRADAFTGTLMLKTRPGVFACGEMLDWDAPTGGYLITACLATGRFVGRAAVDVLRQKQTI